MMMTGPWNLPALVLRDTGGMPGRPVIERLVEPVDHPRSGPVSALIVLRKWNYVLRSGSRRCSRRPVESVITVEVQRVLAVRRHSRSIAPTGAVAQFGNVLAGGTEVGLRSADGRSGGGVPDPVPARAMDVRR